MAAREFSDEEIVEFVLFPVVNESCRVVEEGMVVRPSDVDIGSLFGYSFPRYRFARTRTHTHTHTRAHTHAHTHTHTRTHTRIRIRTHHRTTDLLLTIGVGRPSSGGVLKWADTMPSGRIRDRLAAWDREFGPQTRSRFFAPSAYLHHRADKGLKLVPLSARPLNEHSCLTSASLLIGGVGAVGGGA
jgi:hypothetical protein